MLSSHSQATKEEIEKDIRSLAIQKIGYYTNKIHELGYQIKMGLEMEFMAFAKADCPNAEILNIDAIEARLKETFKNKIEFLIDEGPIGLTSNASGFEFPGVRTYEVVFLPSSSPLAICNLIYQVQNYLKSLENELGVRLDFRAKPIKNSELPLYIKKSKEQGFPGREVNFEEDKIIEQCAGNGIQFNISLWADGINHFFHEDERRGALLFYEAASGLLEASAQSMLPFVAGDNAFLRLNPNDIETAAPGSCKMALWKAGEKGKGIIRPSPYSDRMNRVVKDPDSAEERSNESFRMETRHNDPMQDQYVCMAAVLGSLYYGMVESDMDYEETIKFNVPFETNMADCIQSFNSSKLWKQILGPLMHRRLLKLAEMKQIDACLNQEQPVLFSTCARTNYKAYSVRCAPKKQDLIAAARAYKY